MDYMLHFLKQNAPWDHLGMLAEMEGVGGLLYHHLKTLGLLGSLPKAVIRHLENTYGQTRKQTLAVVAKAEALSSRLEQARVPVLALQGLSLVKVYGDPGLRPLGDADLMVKPGHKWRLKALLLEAGYRMPVFLYPDLFHKDGIWLDIHTHILSLDRIRSRRYLFPEDLTSMWERAIPFSDQSNGLLVLDPYDNFIALAAHALKHSYSRLIWLADLHESLLKWTKNPAGWEGMVERTRFWQQERVVLYGLLLLEGIFDLEVPLWVKGYLGIQRLSVLEKHVIRLKLRGFSSGELCYALWLCHIKGAGKKLEFLRETLFPRGEIMAQIFPQKSAQSNGLVYPKRAVNTLNLFCENLRQALKFSFRAGGIR
jgi:hypothetical protein